MEIPQDSRHRVGFLGFFGFFGFSGFFGFFLIFWIFICTMYWLKIYMWNILYLYIYIYDAPTQAEFGTKIRGHRSSPKIHQKYRKYQQIQLKLRFWGGYHIYIWYNMIWYEMVWYAMVRYDMKWYDHIYLCINMHVYGIIWVWDKMALVLLVRNFLIPQPFRLTVVLQLIGIFHAHHRRPGNRAMKD
jgi:hypothetical protein